MPAFFLQYFNQSFNCVRTFKKKKKVLLKAFWKQVHTVMRLIDKFIDITKYIFNTCRLWLYSTKAVLTFTTVSHMHLVPFFVMVLISLLGTKVKCTQTSAYLYRSLLKTFVKMTLHLLSSFPAIT